MQTNLLGNFKILVEQFTYKHWTFLRTNYGGQVHYFMIATYLFNPIITYQA
jgi:hypothetical protein